MIMYNDIYNAFLTALRHFADKEGYGGQSVFAANAGISNGYLSQILKRPDIKKAGLKTQIALAKACGYEIEDFILFGKKLLAEKQEIEILDVPAKKVKSEPPASDLATDYIENLKQQIKELKAERQEWKAQKEEWTAERTELKKEIAELKERIRSLEAQLSMTAESDVKKIAG